MNINAIIDMVSEGRFDEAEKAAHEMARQIALNGSIEEITQKLNTLNHLYWLQWEIRNRDIVAVECICNQLTHQAVMTFPTAR